MWLHALITQVDLEQLLRALTPVCVYLDPARQRYVCLDQLTSVELVAGDAVYFEMTGRVAWDVVGIGVPFRVRKLRVRAVPAVSVVDDRDALTFQLEIEHADLSSVPSFIESHVIAATNEALAERGAKLAWHFTRTLDFRFTLPENSQPRRQVHLYASGGSAEVRSDGVLIAAAFDADATSLEDEGDGATETNAQASTPADDDVIAAPYYEERT